MSIFQVIFVIYLLFSSVLSSKNELDQVLKEGKANDRAHDRADHPGCPRKFSGEPEQIDRLDLDDLWGYRFPAFFAGLLFDEAQVQPDRPTIDA